MLLELIGVCGLDLLSLVELLLADAGVQFLLFLRSTVQRLVQVFLELFKLYLACFAVSLHNLDIFGESECRLLTHSR